MSMQTPLESDPQPIVPIIQSQRRLIRSVSVGKSLITSPPKQELSSQGTVFFSPTNASPIKSRLPLVPYRDANGEIVDFHDKTQVYKLIASVNEKAEKIKIIDLVRKRREEMDSAKKKRKKQKASTNVFGSIHSPFDSEFQPTHTINRFRKSLKEIYNNEKSLTIIPTCSNSTADNTPLVRQSQKPKTLVIVNKNRIEFTESDDSERSEIQGTRLVFPVIENEKTPSIQSPKTVSRSSLSSGTGFRFGNQNTALGETSNLLNKTAGYDNSISQRRRLNKKLEVKFGSIGEFRKPPESLSVDSSSPAKSTLSGFSKRTENIDTEAKPIHHDRENDMYVLGRSKLEKDIFKYLMKSKEGKDNNLVLGLAPQKEEKLRNIETGALIQYVQAHPFEDLTYIPNNLLKIKKHKLEKAKTQAILNGSNKRPVAQIKQRPDPKGCLMRIDQGARSSSFIRKVDPTQVFCDESPKPKGAIKGRKIDLNDSLVSHTETRLDCLYKEVRQMNKAIKRIEDKIDMSKSQQESKSLLRMKEMKLKDYSEHSTKIKILIKKKVTDVYS